MTGIDCTFSVSSSRKFGWEFSQEFGWEFSQELASRNCVNTQLKTLMVYHSGVLLYKGLRGLGPIEILFTHLDDLIRGGRNGLPLGILKRYRAQDISESAGWGIRIAFWDFSVLERPI